MLLTNTELANWILQRSNLKSVTSATPLIPNNEVRVQICSLSITVIDFSSLKMLTELSAFLRRAELNVAVVHTIALNDDIVYYSQCWKIAPNTWDCRADKITASGEYCDA